MSSISQSRLSAPAVFAMERRVFCGRVQGIRDLVSYEAPDMEGLESAFRESVDDYLSIAKTAARS